MRQVIVRDNNFNIKYIESYYDEVLVKKIEYDKDLNPVKIYHGDNLVLNTSYFNDHVNFTPEDLFIRIFHGVQIEEEYGTLLSGNMGEWISLSKNKKVIISYEIKSKKLFNHKRTFNAILLVFPYLSGTRLVDFVFKMLKKHFNIEAIRDIEH